MKRTVSIALRHRLPDDTRDDDPIPRGGSSASLPSGRPLAAALNSRIERSRVVPWAILTAMFQRMVVLGCCLLGAFALQLQPSPGAAERPLTEAEGGTPASASDSNPPVEHYDPKSTITFTDQGAFLNASWCETISMESFEDLPATNFSDQMSIAVPDFTVTTDHPPRLGIWDRNFQDASASDGTHWLGVNENRLVVPQTTTFTFNAPVNHFGIKISDYGDFGGGNLMYSDDAGNVATAAVSGQPSGNRQFFGIITRHTQFTTVTLQHTVPGEFYGIDEVSYCLAMSAPYPQVRRPAARLIPGGP
jgi:hypothetical protein